MNMQRTHTKPAYTENFEVLDAEFDSFDLDDGLAFLLHETEHATLFHKALRFQE
ncbi:MAG: hypothetical protein ABL951_10830 [Alphaproteobacteria bacterium]